MGKLLALQIKENAEISGIDALVEHYAFFIDPMDDMTIGDMNDGGRSFFYTIRGVISDGPARYQGYGIRQERYVETFIPEEGVAPSEGGSPARRTIDITKFYKRFREKLNRL